jgi:EAL and modified HD-GYP domain-containing signal transduction protein
VKVYSARQAILNRKQHVVAYELFFRDGPENIFPEIDPDLATAKLVMRTHLNDGFKSITSGKPAFINLSEKSLLKGLPKLLPNKEVVFEILEDVPPSDDVYHAMRDLYQRGYHMALDDFIYRPEWARFLKFVKMVKFDIHETPLEKIKPLVQQLQKHKHIRLLAEKVETKEQFELAKKLGFHFFQGYFFCKPEMRESKDIASDKMTLMSVYREVLRSPIDLDKLTQYFNHNVNLSFKLLRFINSGVLPLSQEINSIKQALVYLGEQQVRKFVALLITAIEAHNKPQELVKMAIIRARFCELIANKACPEKSESAFLTGLFSLIDALLDRPMPVLLAQLPLADEIKDALTEEKRSTLGTILNVAKLYEKGRWYQTERQANVLRLSYEQIADCYQQALKWVDYYDEANQFTWED